MKRKIILLIAVLLFSVASFSQLDKFSQRLGVSLKASTNGLGGDIFYQHSKKFAVKVGAEYISINLSSNRIERYINSNPNISINNPYGSDIIFNTEGKFKTGAISLSAGYQFSKRFYVTAGLSKSLFDSKATGLSDTDVVFKLEDVPLIGIVAATIYKEDVACYQPSLFYNSDA